MENYASSASNIETCGFISILWDINKLIANLLVYIEYTLTLMI